GFAKGREAGKRGGGQGKALVSSCRPMLREKIVQLPRFPPSPLKLARHVQRLDPDQPAPSPRRACGTVSHDRLQSTEAQGRAAPCRGPGTLVQLWVRGSLSPAERAAEPGTHHPARGEPRV